MPPEDARQEMPGVFVAFTEIGVLVLGKRPEGVEAKFDLGPCQMDAVFDETRPPSRH